MLSERKRQILRAVIQDYVQTAEPVASRTLSKKYDFGLSAATIRNELADLEEEGLLRQPHTSAGRIPSDIGYRVFVDTLMERDRLSAEKQQAIEHYQRLSVDLPDLLSQTAKITAVLSQCTAIVRAPRVNRSRVKFIQLLPVADTATTADEVLLVILMDQGNALNHRLRLPSPITPDELGFLGSFLNAHLRGRTLDELTHQLLEKLCREVRAYQDLLTELWTRITGGSEAERVYLSHTSFLAQQPEFLEPGKVGSLLNLLEREQLVASLLDRLHGPSGEAMVAIGGELPFADLQECSVVTASYGTDDDLRGEIAVIGPTRMKYATAMETVEWMARQLTRSMNQLFGVD